MRQSERESRFMKVVNDSRQLLCKVCYMYATDRDHFQDLYQEVLANIWVGLDSFRGESAISTWLYRTAINTCVTFFRRHSSHAASMTSLDLAADLEADDGVRMEQLREMYRLISDLDKLDKAIILMWLDERSYDEIAEVTGFTRNNVATRLHRIKQRLAENSRK
ncbi:MAG: sigma-70 family RNA polymerase sigma factor [Duncaniella sp.]|nr:sigma-70 family RNA polymerase sigma factor [Duncaniella sp.]MDE6175331.1 sigma-70 family RNA polymerase sigma factor [Duncaniella sp.]